MFAIYLCVSSHTITVSGRRLSLMFSEYRTSGEKHEDDGKENNTAARIKILAKLNFEKLVTRYSRANGMDAETRHLRNAHSTIFFHLKKLPS